MRGGVDDSELFDDIELATDSDLQVPELVLSADGTAIEEAHILNKPDSSSLYLSVGDTYDLEVEILPEDATEIPVFVSSNEAVATVSEDGTITAHQTGSCKVSVKCESDESWSERDSISFQVREHAVHVTLHANGGIFSYYGKTIYEYYAESGGYMSLPNQQAQAENKAFIGWYADEACTQLVTEKDYFYPTESMELYAGWSDSYRITYDYQGILVDGLLQKMYQVPQGNKIGSNRPYIPTDNPADTGDKLFAGWRNEQGELITSGKIGSYIPQKDETLTAVWSDYYTILFDYNDGTGKQKVAYAIPGEKLSNPPSRPGQSPTNPERIFVGWVTEKGMLMTHDEAYNYVPTGNETLTAIWEKFYTVTFDPNGGTFTNGNTEQKVAAGTAISSLPSDYQISREGYLLTGWRVKDTQEPVVNGVYIPTKDVTLVAEWSEYWTVTYDANGGKPNSDSDSYKFAKVEKGASVYLNGSGYTKEGSKLLGWCENPEGTGTIYTGYYKPTRDITLYAKWNSGKLFRITLDAGEGWFSSVHTKIMEVEEGNTVGIMTEPKWSGGRFEGWYLDREYTKPVNRAYEPTGDTTFYAKWKTEDEYYTVSIHAGGPYYRDTASGTWVSEAQIKIAKGASVGNISASRSGYEDIWYLDEAHTILFDSNYVPESDIDLYADYLKQVTISWDGDGGRDGRYGRKSGTEICGQGEHASLPGSRYMKKEGYVFDGWWTLDGKEITAATRFYQNLSVKAHWTEGCKVTLDLAGGTLDSSYERDYLPDYYVKKGQKYGMGGRPKKAGCAFLGWKNEETGELKTSLSSVIIEKDSAFTAQWSNNVCKVTFHAVDGMIHDEKTGYRNEAVVWIQSDKKGMGAVSAPNPTHDGGLGFVGWALEENGPIVDVDEYLFDRDTDFYAVYAETGTIRVTFVLNGGIYSGSITEVLKKERS